jgi:hypothetical protein
VAALHPHGERAGGGGGAADRPAAARGGVAPGVTVNAVALKEPCSR